VIQLRVAETAQSHPGVAPQATPRRRTALPHRVLAWAVATLATAACGFLYFVYTSTRPVMHLREAPPDAFIAPEPGWTASRKAAELELARSYWNNAVHNLQHIYTYEMKLPEHPPPEFKLGPELANRGFSMGNLETTRRRYWGRLRAIWDRPDAWEVSYEWKAPWFGGTLGPLGQALRRLSP